MGANWSEWLGFGTGTIWGELVFRWFYFHHKKLEKMLIQLNFENSPQIEEINQIHLELLKI